jgi:hypothetical protein
VSELPAYEQLIQYRRRLREEQAAVNLRFGLPLLALNNEKRRKWHVTTSDEVPAVAECGAQLVQLAGRKFKQPVNLCKRCRSSPHFVDVWDRE